MTISTIDLNDLLSKTEDADFLRQMVGFAAQRLMDLELEGLCGASYGERSDDRLIRSSAVSHKIPCITTLAATAATIQGIEWWLQKPLLVRPLQDYHSQLQ